MDNLKLYDERVKRMGRAIRHEENDRVPIFGLVDNWALSYYGTTLSEAKENIEIEYAAYSKALTDFQYDMGAFQGITFPLKFAESLGGGIYSNNTETIQIATSKSEIMSADEYPEFIKDPMAFIVNKILPRKCGIFQDGTVEEKFSRLMNTINEFSNFGQSRQALSERYKADHGLPVCTAAVPFMPGDLFLDYMRDFKGTMMDVRRNSDALAEACMKLVQYDIMATYAVLPQPAEDRYLGVFLHLPPYLKPKDFEKVYWPSFKAYVEHFAGQGYKFMILFEKNWEHLYEYLTELPKNCILGLFEEDDLRKAKKVFGDTICIGGGIKTTDLQYKTKEQCIDIAKSLIDDLAPGGGYVFAADKVMLSANDGKPENLKAVTDFVHDYAVYK
ncbi:uroporphyrinogen decarboxylase family protein [Eubacterium sp. 1001713B170207_170306_E7]|uniref:uroporphyrinogen decarboxylase family protein n=1 Tax=Eubacterium sp. 1001713B170207_170306_E7 TaxID=2787097 RepID=UPI00189A1FE6|nr:uroporphyrinogen decarboxylase family protein [Eubacterium sp. 1001713B170207_170306_E7]